ncbi:adhesion G-protein coupled receptor G5 [Acanthopagrus schlegelii]
MKTNNGSYPYLLTIVRQHVKRKLHLNVLHGRQCNTTLSNLTESKCINSTGSCQITCFKTETCETSPYNQQQCNNNSEFFSGRNDLYLIDITATKNSCMNCNNPVKMPETDIGPEAFSNIVNVTLDINEGEEFSAAQAATVMSVMSDLASSINGSSAALSLGEGVEGVLVRETEPADINEVLFAYASPKANISMVDSKDKLDVFSRSIAVPEEAFEQSLRMNVSVPFAAVFRFLNMTKDENNSTVLGNEVIAIEMGTKIRDLTENISIIFRNMKYKGYPSCQSWDGEGGRPNWTDNGCQTMQDGDNITCQCSHLTFFAILLTPLNETISSSDLYKLTIITQVGCGLSMFFLGIVLFMHFLLRRAKASTSTRILIQLVTAMFLLNLSFLVNNYVAKTKHTVGCKIMAAIMHYFMLATFTWFAVQAFHLCLQLYMEGKIVIRRYMLKVCIISWVLPSFIGIVLLIVGKYGEQVISTSDTEENVAMCWITDSNAHYVVNIGYYALVFIFTLTTFIIVLSWLFCRKRAAVGTAEDSRSGKNIITILGLCCMLGVTWGFAFFAYGVLRIPSYYIFTVLNSFQGFFLFIYYYNTSHSGNVAASNTTSSSTTTLKTNLDIFDNPYSNTQKTK